jgi:hypothetical protein
MWQSYAAVFLDEIDARAQLAGIELSDLGILAGNFRTSLEVTVKPGTVYLMSFDTISMLHINRRQRLAARFVSDCLQVKNEHDA